MKHNNPHNSITDERKQVGSVAAGFKLMGLAIKCWISDTPRSWISSAQNCRQVPVRSVVISGDLSPSFSLIVLREYRGGFGRN